MPLQSNHFIRRILLTSRLFYLIPGVAVSELCWSKACLLLKLPHKVILTFISAPGTDFQNSQIRASQIFPGFFNPPRNYILYNTVTKNTAVQMLKAGAAKVHKGSHIVYTIKIQRVLKKLCTLLTLPKMVCILKQDFCSFERHHFIFQ